ncbi:IclR family transcriptional regulator [uncultured Pigmentiphaga sp.]|uniref:IclR family transcriptional regulator n=1 Tax=uncultured Pigmentiphaga sp. TaxID=340361 RepID=UPI002620429D|nr:IclR family transcriptional regulator [uncultured Pigmentiphaga sp.]
MPSDGGTDRKAEGVAAVDRAFAILNAFRATDVSLTLNEIAQRTGMYKSTILRLIASLANAHCIVRLDDGSYQLGSMLLHWGGIYQAALRLDDHVPPMLRRLVLETEEGASFFTREGNLRVCLFRVDSPRSVRDHIRTGDLLPLDRGAAGRVLQNFDRTLVSPDEFPSQPYVFTVGEREPDIAAIAAPVFGPQRSLRGALAISGPAARFSEDRLPIMRRALLKAASDLTRRLGGDSTIFERWERQAGE